MAGFVPFLFMSLIAGCVARPFYPLPSKISNENKQPIQTSRPYNIAHRGSNGEIPEETAVAYMVCLTFELAYFLQICILSLSVLYI